MAKHIFFLGFVVTIACASAVAAFAEKGAKPSLTVRLSGFRSEGNAIIVKLYSEAQGKAFLREGVPCTLQKAKVNASDVTLYFESIEPGRYAVAIHHDEDEDGIMDTGFLGIPSEGYGFSMDPKMRLGPPGFGAAAFTVAGDMEIRIKVKYF